MESPLPPDPYAALGVSKDASAAIIKSTYRKLVLKCHPDKVTDEALKQKSAEDFHRIQQAYEILGDEDKRARYDAIVRLAELRRQHMELHSDGPRVSASMRAAANYEIRTPPTTRGGYASSRGVRVEERRPKYYEEDYVPRGRYADYDYVKRASAAIPRAERVRVDRDSEERRRADRRREREGNVRESRDRKYEEEERYARGEAAAAAAAATKVRRDDEERERRAEEVRTPEAVNVTERKYVDAEQYATRYMESQSEGRPGVRRRMSTNAVPQYYVHRSAAPGKDRERERVEHEKERERLERERDRLERLEKQHERDARERSDREARERLERDRYDREMSIQREKLRERESQSQSQSQSQTAAARARKIENVEPFDRRPATLQTHHSSPPVANPASYDAPYRRNTTPGGGNSSGVDAQEPPVLNRASTMPTKMPDSQPSPMRKGKDSSPTNPSRLRNMEPAFAPQGYTASPVAMEGSYSPQTQPNSYPKATERRYDYSHVEDADSTPLPRSNEYGSGRRSAREPTSRRTRSPSPIKERERPSSTAKKMANLAPSSSPRVSARSSKAAYAMESSSSSRPVQGRSSRSPEHSSRRERSDRREERDRPDDRYPSKAYGEKGPGAIRGERSSPYDSYESLSSKKYDMDDMNYPSKSKRQREFVRPSLGRSSTSVY